MEKDLKKMETAELIELYKIIQDFVSFLEKEDKNIEKMRDSND